MALPPYLLSPHPWATMMAQQQAAHAQLAAAAHAQAAHAAAQQAQVHQVHHHPPSTCPTTQAT